ncbi:hypothetical protein JCM5350_003420 [Sporobolomyces pararoseus]
MLNQNQSPRLNQIQQRPRRTYTRHLRSFLDPARKHLYSRPLVRGSWASWEKAVCLHRTLSDNPSLASLVRDLRGLAIWILDLNDSAGSSLDLPFRQPTCLAGTAWASVLIRLCSNRQYVEFPPSSLQFSSELLEALKSSTSTLKIIRFIRFSDPDPKCSRDPSTYKYIGALLSTSILKNVNLVEIEDNSRPTLSD